MPTLVHGDRDAAFLDVPGVGADDLFAIVRQVLAEMASDAILTVFTDQPGIAEAAAEWYAVHAVELIAVIADEAGGETLALRRAGTV